MYQPVGPIELTGDQPVQQGDLRVDPATPSADYGAPREPDHEDGYILARSSTAHHHVLYGDVEVYGAPDGPPGSGYFIVRTGRAELRHLRGEKPHEPFSFPPGAYTYRRQREATPDGWHLAAD